MLLGISDDAFAAERRRRAERKAKEEGDAVRRRCKTLYGFVKECWQFLEPETAFVENWHLKAICGHLEAVTRGEITRLLINVPPGCSKSLLVSVIWPAWEWGPAGKSHLRYLTSSFNIDAVKRDTRKCRDLILTDWYRTLWPHVRLVRTAEASYANTNGGTREGSPFGSLTSKRGDRLILDDPHSVATAESDSERTETVRLFTEGARNRLNDQERSAIIIVMQRLHDQDISGWVLKHDKAYVHLCLPMEFDAARKCVTPIGFEDPRTTDGEILDPIRFPPRTLESFKLSGSYFYSGQYQQSPSPRQGGFFQVEKIGRVASIPANVVRRCRGWDRAGTEEKAGKDPDYTAGVRMSKTRNGKFIIEHVLRKRETGGAVRVTIRATSEQDRAKFGEVIVHLAQDPGADGKTIAEDYSRILAGFSLRIETVGAKSKQMRADPFASQVELGNVSILETGDPMQDAWIEPFIDELRRFPVGHDDQVDAAADAFKVLAAQSAQGWFEHMEDQVAEMHAKRKAAG